MTTTTHDDGSPDPVAKAILRPRHQIADDDLRAAIADARSWRGVLRALGIPASAAGTSRRLRRRADELGYSYAHFGHQQERWQRTELREAVVSAQNWTDMMEWLGCSASSGSARNSIRRECARLGIDTTSLDVPPRPLAGDLPVQPRAEHLRSAGSMLVAAALTLAGHRVSWPLEPAVYDLLVDVSSSQPLRVQVKTTTHQVGGTWLCNLTRSASSSSDGRYSLDDIDYFGIVDGEHVVYLLPAAVLGGMSSMSTRAYQQYRVARLTT
jgi:hypothetical protein